MRGCNTPVSVLRLGLTVSEIRSHQKPDHETVLLYRTVLYSGIHYQKGAKATNAQRRREQLRGRGFTGRMQGRKGQRKEKENQTIKREVYQDGFIMAGMPATIWYGR